MRRPKWWNIDWVELGCRGWDISLDGACCGEQRRRGGRYASCFVYLDRNTLGLHLHGEPSFLANAVSDLIASGVFEARELPNASIVRWNMNMSPWLDSDTYSAGTTTGNSGYALKLIA